MHTNVVDRLIREFGPPRETLHWSIAPAKPGRSEITIQVEGDPGEACKTVKVWVFNPAKETAETAFEQIACGDDIDRLVARIRAELMADGV